MTAETYEDEVVVLLREIRDLLAESVTQVTYVCPPLWVDADGEQVDPGTHAAREICPGGVELRQHSRDYWKSEDDKDRLYHPLPEHRHYTGPGFSGQSTEIRNHNVWKSRAIRARGGDAPTGDEGSTGEPAGIPPATRSSDDGAHTSPPPERSEDDTDRTPVSGWSHVNEDGTLPGLTQQWSRSYERLKPLLGTLWKSYGKDWAALWEDWGDQTLMAQIRGTDDVFVVTPGSLSNVEVNRLAQDIEQALARAAQQE